MALYDFSLADWTQISDEVARRECEDLARELPFGLKLASLEMHSYCGRIHRVARFSGREAGDLVHFVLVPGGEVTLGFNGANFKPRAWQIASYRPWPVELLQRGVDLRDVQFSINEFVDANTSPPRTAHVLPLLVEVEARKIEPREDLEPLDPGHPEFEKFRNECYQARLAAGETIETWSGSGRDSHHIAEHDSNGVLSVWRRPKTTINVVKEQLREMGMRLPTCDEWEHACGGGATTLFRWGDDTPSDHYPDDTCAEDRELKRACALSRGKLRYETPPPGWDLHARPNLFGLRIASNPYRRDLVADEPWALGGDGGCYTSIPQVGEKWLAVVAASDSRWGHDSRWLS
jgi:formylglycine-generating enzyme required for sulfatase activity